MPRFTNTEIVSAISSVALSAKMQGLLPWDANLVYNPSTKTVTALHANGELFPALFLPEFEEGVSNKDVMRALTATYRVLRATEEKNGVELPGDPSNEDSPIYWDDFIEDDETPVGNLPFREKTARIIDERQGGVIAYCHVDSAGSLVEALRSGKLAIKDLSFRS